MGYDGRRVCREPRACDCGRRGHRDPFGRCGPHAHREPFGRVSRPTRASWLARALSLARASRPVRASRPPRPVRSDRHPHKTNCKLSSRHCTRSGAVYVTLSVMSPQRHLSMAQGPQKTVPHPTPRPRWCPHGLRWTPARRRQHTQAHFSCNSATKTCSDLGTREVIRLAHSLRLVTPRDR